VAASRGIADIFPTPGDAAWSVARPQTTRTGGHWGNATQPIPGAPVCKLLLSLTLDAVLNCSDSRDYSRRFGTSVSTAPASVV
jgi:hypothetical protein